MIHVVWDWNGTLVEDLPVVVESVNAALDAIGEAPITEDDYRGISLGPSASSTNDCWSGRSQTMS